MYIYIYTSIHLYIYVSVCTTIFNQEQVLASVMITALSSIDHRKIRCQQNDIKPGAPDLPRTQQKCPVFHRCQAKKKCANCAMGKSWDLSRPFEEIWSRLESWRLFTQLVGFDASCAQRFDCNSLLHNPQSNEFTVYPTWTPPNQKLRMGCESLAGHESGHESLRVFKSYSFLGSVQDTHCGGSGCLWVCAKALEDENPKIPRLKTRRPCWSGYTLW